MDEILISLELPSEGVKEYKMIQVFSVEDGGAQYCALAETGQAETPEILFLRCSFAPAGEQDDGDRQMTLELIPDKDEYEFISSAYLNWVSGALQQDLQETLENEPDFFVALDKDGNEVSFIAHAIFDDETNGRSYIAVQPLLDDGSISEEISFYRFFEGDPCNIDMIRSDMEYDRVKELFLKMLSAS